MSSSSLPFDRAHLSTFTGGDMALEREILEDFCINAEAHIASLNAAIGTPNWGECAHRLKGASSGVGMRDLARLCAAAEALDPDAPHHAADMVKDMRAYLDGLAAYLKS